MNKFVAWLKKEILEIIPPTVFFFIAFHLLAFTKALMLDQYGISASSSAAATIGALIVGKVVLIADKLPLINRFPEKPLIYNVTWKTLIYLAVALLFRYAEHIIPLLSEYGSLRAATRHLLDEVVWPHFWAIQLWLSILLFVYVALRELIREIGRDAAREMFFGRPKTA
jgi:hypothetical protein